MLRSQEKRNASEKESGNCDVLLFSRQQPFTQIIDVFRSEIYTMLSILNVTVTVFNAYEPKYYTANCMEKDTYCSIAYLYKKKTTNHFYPIVKRNKMIRFYFIYIALLPRHSLYLIGKT